MVNLENPIDHCLKNISHQIKPTSTLYDHFFEWDVPSGAGVGRLQPKDNSLYRNTKCCKFKNTARIGIPIKTCHRFENVNVRQDDKKAKLLGATKNLTTYLLSY